MDIDTREAWITTVSGVRVDLVDPDPATIHIADIAHSLAAQCRYNGHCKPWYSVAEHSVLVSHWLEGHGETERVQLLGLLHDATEAYIGDITWGVKQLIPEIRQAEHRLAPHIYNALGILPPTEDEEHIIKLGDRVLLVTEFQDMMGCGLVMDGLPDADEGMVFCYLDAKNARECFLANWRCLAEKVGI